MIEFIPFCESILARYFKWELNIDMAFFDLLINTQLWPYIAKSCFGQVRDLQAMKTILIKW